MPATRLRVFISSVQKEFETTRHDLKAFLLGDREAFGISDRTALRDLNELIDKGVLERIGKTGHQTYYIIKIPTRHEPDMKEI